MTRTVTSRLVDRVLRALCAVAGVVLLAILGARLVTDPDPGPAFVFIVALSAAAALFLALRRSRGPDA